jgi:hypothetical protein
MKADGDQSLPFGNPPVLEHSTPTGATEIAQRLIPFPFTPPDVKLKEKEALSSSNDWLTSHDKNKIDELGGLDFYATSGPQSVGVVPKLHNTSAGAEIYRLPPTLSKDAFEKTEGPYRPGITKKFSNKRSGEKIAKFKMSPIAEPGLACFYVSRLLGHLVEVPPATYRTMDIQEFQKVHTAIDGRHFHFMRIAIVQSRKEERRNPQVRRCRNLTQITHINEHIWNCGEVVFFHSIANW